MACVEGQVLQDFLNVGSEQVRARSFSGKRKDESVNDPSVTLEGMSKNPLDDQLAPDLLHRVRERFSTWPLIEGLGLEVRDLQLGSARLFLPSSPRVMNGPRGNINGGWLSNLADMACAFALCTAFDGKMPFATSDLHIRYLEPAMGDVEAEALVVRRSKNSAVLECRISCGDTLVSFCTAHFSIKSTLVG
jgi:uncharacterized protein (TIGR00369 family)